MVLDRRFEPRDRLLGMQYATVGRASGDRHPHAEKRIIRIDRLARIETDHVIRPARHNESLIKQGAQRQEVGNPCGAEDVLHLEYGNSLAAAVAPPGFAMPGDRLWLRIDGTRAHVIRRDNDRVAVAEAA